MKKSIDGTHRVAAFDSLLDMVNCAAAQNPRWFNGHSGSWVGRYFYGWPDFKEKWDRPWADGMRTADAMRKEIAAQVPEPPKVVRRRRLRSETDGEFDFDRYLEAEPDFYTATKRAEAAGPTTLTVLCHLGGVAKHKPETLFWRGAAACVAVDVLEAAGYSCEVWWWHRSVEVFTSGARNFFCGGPVKKAGDPLDADQLLRALSSWYYRGPMLASFAASGPVSDGLGITEHDDLGMCARHLGVSGRVVQMPAAYDRAGAVEGARTMIAEVQNSPVAG